MRREFQIGWWMVAAILLLTLPGRGQVQYGDLKMNMNGIISGGYSGNYGNLIGSSHNLAMGGSGNFSGSFYDPNFLNFSLAPYYDRSQANSGYQSISDASGFNLTSGIFSGSHFPGSITLAKAYNSQGVFAVPGLAGYSTFGNSSTLGLHWSELVPGLPTLSFGYQQGSNDYSVFGTNDTGNSHNHNFNLQSTYALKGFDLGAYYSQGASNSAIPEVLGNSGGTQPQMQTTSSDNSGYGATVSHKVPFDGQVIATFNRSDINSNFLGYRFDGIIDTYNASMGLQPTQKLHLSFNADYSDNLAGQLYQSASPTAAVIAPTSQESHATGLQAQGSYNLLANLQTQVYVDRRTQYFLGENLGATAYGEGVSYGRGLLGGSFSTSLFVIENTRDNSDEHTLGLSTSVGFNRRIGLWSFGGAFNYAQNVQTLLISYTTSYYNYSFNVRKKFNNRLVMSGGAGFTQSGLTAEPGTNSSSKSFSAGMGYGQWIAVSGSYSKANGQGLLGGGGINSTPLPPVIPDSLLILYGGRSYSAAVSSTPIRRFTMSAGFSKSNSNTFNAGVGSQNSVEQFNTYFQYRFRKMNLTGGYSRLVQGFTAAGTPPAQLSSFSIGVSRWFNFF